MSQIDGQIKTVQVYNTATRSVQELRTQLPGQARVYCCGPTVYTYPHIGNLRAYIFEDLLMRVLRRAGYAVTHVMNITDVGHLVSDADEGEDKMVVAARREGKSSLAIAERYTQVFFEDCARLNIRRPDIVCKATDHIGDMIELIQRIEARGFTYVSGGNVYFDISKLPDYGKLAKLDLAALQAGARVEVDSNKRNPLDFALWFTKSKFENQELQWDSPWGRGYPGWHIECSAMAIKYLGEQFDIHCGGVDHIPVHHTNEIAQSEAATGKPWVPYWMHGEFLVSNAEKMSKSKGGFVTVSTIIENGVDPLALRFFCIAASYRSQLNFSWESLQNAASALRKLQDSVLELGDPRTVRPPPNWTERGANHLESFDQAVFNDLGVPKALATVWAVIGDKELSTDERLALLINFDQVLGLGIGEWRHAVLEIPAAVQKLAEQRLTARKEKNWGESDRLRAAIQEQGFQVEDSGGEQKLRKL